MAPKFTPQDKDSPSLFRRYVYDMYASGQSTGSNAQSMNTSSETPESNVVLDGSQPADTEARAQIPPAEGIDQHLERLSLTPAATGAANTSPAAVDARSAVLELEQLPEGEETANLSDNEVDAVTAPSSPSAPADDNFVDDGISNTELLEAVSPFDVQPNQPQTVASQELKESERKIRLGPKSLLAAFQRYYEDMFLNAHARIVDLEAEMQRQQAECKAEKAAFKAVIAELQQEKVDREAAARTLYSLRHHQADLTRPGEMPDEPDTRLSTHTDGDSPAENIDQDVEGPQAGMQQKEEQREAVNEGQDEERKGDGCSLSEKGQAEEETQAEENPNETEREEYQNRIALLENQVGTAQDLLEDLLANRAFGQACLGRDGSLQGWFVWAKKYERED